MDFSEKTPFPKDPFFPNSSCGLQGPKLPNVSTSGAAERPNEERCGGGRLGVQSFILKSASKPLLPSLASSWSLRHAGLSLCRIIMSPETPCRKARGAIRTKITTMNSFRELLLWFRLCANSRIACDFKLRIPNRKNFQQIAVERGPNHTLKSRDLWFGPLFNSNCLLMEVLSQEMAC